MARHHLGMSSHKQGSAEPSSPSKSIKVKYGKATRQTKSRPKPGKKAGGKMDTGETAFRLGRTKF